MAKSRATFCCSGAYKKTLNYSVAEIRKRIKSLDMQIAVSTIFSLVKKYCENVFYQWYKRVVIRLVDVVKIKHNQS